MKFLPDTNACIAFMRGEEVMTNKWLSYNLEDFALSSIVYYELSMGPLLCPTQYRESQSSKLHKLVGIMQNHLQWSYEDAEAAASIRANLTKSGKMIGPYDLLIAGQAISRGLTLITQNTREFSRVSNLTIENWNEA